jgi:hypothetical protein
MDLTGQLVFSAAIIAVWGLAIWVTLNHKSDEGDDDGTEG